MRREFNKLVRDKIPEIITSKGEKAEVRNLSSEEFRERLSNKLIEEIGEYLISTDDESAIEELADLLEVVYAIARTHNCTQEQLNAVCATKREARGGFDKGVFLIATE